MDIKNNYNECITNYACSIRKYFGLDYKHNTLSHVDKILEEYNPKNVVTILCDGMGSNILDKVLDKDDFLIRNRIKQIYTVFPATTVAATTSIQVGLNPVETAMLGWNMYYKDIDKIITTFRDSLKEDKESKPIKEAMEYKNKHMITKTIVDEINEKGQYKGYTLSPFKDTIYSNLDEMYNLIEGLCNDSEKKYIYAYDMDPDHTMHITGTYSNEVINIIKDRNKRIEELSRKLTDTIIFVTADHGHIPVENIFLGDYPDIVDCLKRNTSLDSRAVFFFIKENKQDSFVRLFNKYFGNDFYLYTKEEVINSKIFGPGEEKSIFRDILGDYLAIAKTNKTLLYIGNSEYKSHHAGYTDDELLVPLISIETPKKKVKKL